MRPRLFIEKVTKTIKSRGWPFALASKNVSYFLSQISRSPKGQDFSFEMDMPLSGPGDTLRNGHSALGDSLVSSPVIDTFLSLFQFSLTAARPRGCRRIQYPSVALDSL